MNLHSLRYVQGRVYQICSLLFLLPLLVALFYREFMEALLSFGLLAAGLFLLGSLMTLKRPDKVRLRASEGMVITFFTWLSLSLVSALAYVLSGKIPYLVAAYF